MSEEKSLFSEVSSSSQRAENQVETMFQNRQEEFNNESNLANVKSKVIDHDLSLGNDARSKYFRSRRLNARINLKVSKSLVSNLTIPKDWYDSCQDMDVRPEMLSNIVQEFNNNTDVKIKYKGLVGIRKLLSLPTNPPIQEVIDLGLVSQFIDLLGNSYAEFEYESLWCLTNVACGTSDQANAILSKGGLEKIKLLMDSKIEEVQEQATWTLGNLAGDSIKVRDAVINQGGFQKLITIFATANRKNLVKQCAWSVSNFCRNKPILPYEMLRKALDYVIKSVNLFFDDTEILVDATWTLSTISENYKKSIKEIIDSNILPKILACLEKEHQIIILSCLRVIGNIAAGDANQTQLLLDIGVLNYLKKTIFHPKKSIRKD